MGLYIKTQDGCEIEQRSKYSKIKCRYNNKEIDEKEFIEKYNITIIDILKILNDNKKDMNRELLKHNFKIIELSIPEYIININDHQFNNIYTLEQISTFARCFKLKEIDVPSVVTQLEYGCFMNCSALEKIKLPSSIETIEQYVFSSCEKLKEISLPKELKTIRYGAFYNCKSLEKIELPQSIKIIKGWAFGRCKALKEIKLPERLKIIGDGAFSHCKALEIIEIPSSIESIKVNAFYDCSNLKEIIFEDENYKEKPDLQSFIICYKDKIKIKSLDEIIEINTENNEKGVSGPDEIER